jgi:hypothetical protein
MMAVHVLPELDPDGSLSTSETITRGRASAAFAVLAGVALSLANGGTRPLTGRPWAAAAAGLVVRCLLLAGIGLFLGGIDSGLAIILVYYALLFLLAAPLLAMPARPLALLAVALALWMPVFSHLARQDLPDKRGYSPFFTDLAIPGTLLTELTLTGYYPVLTWTAYLCAGLAVGRLDLSSRRTASGLLLAGAGLAVGSALASRVLVDRAVDGGHLPAAADRQLYSGVTPTDTWWWLVVDYPHTGTPLDLAATTGSALALLGALLLLAPLLGLALLPLAYTGSMTLTLYSLHALALALEIGPTDPEELYVSHVVVALLLATAWRLMAPRGPLEELVSQPSRGAAASVLSSGGTR